MGRPWGHGTIFVKNNKEGEQMSIIDINKYKKKMTLKRKIIMILILLIIIISIALIITYIKNETFRRWADEYVFNKNIENIDNAYIEIDLSKDLNIYAYEDYVTILEKNNLSFYNSNAIKVFELEININNPLYSKSNKYLCMAEKNGNNIYLVSAGNIIWQKNVEGAIQNINVNKNGYVTIIEKGTSYKNIITTIDTDGKELFKTYLSSSTAIGAEISEDNKYLAIAEVDTTGAIIKSNIKIISIDKAKSDPSDSIKYSISANQGDLITDIKYQDKNKLVCMYDTGIHVIDNGEDNEIIKFDSKINTANIRNKNNIIYTREKSSGLLSTVTEIVVKNIQNSGEIIYSVDSTIKSVQVYENNIAINMGIEAEFISTNGWLQKKYKSSKEITKIVLGNSVAGVIYKDKIEIINL